MLSASRRDLCQHLAQVPDPRGYKGRLHVLSAILTAVICAILQNCRGYDAIGQWLERVASRHLASAGVPTDPAHDQRLAEGVNVAVFEQALTRWITDVLGELPDREGPLPIAVNGKSLRGSWDRFGQAVHLSMASGSGGMLRCWFEGLADVTKRHLVETAAHNLGRVMWKLLGVGKPRRLQWRDAAALATVWTLLSCVRSAADRCRIRDESPRPRYWTCGVGRRVVS